MATLAFVPGLITAADLDDLVSTWDTYNPAWATSGTQPVIGNGTKTARYKQIGRFVIVTLGITAGSTTTFGTGQWDFALPVTAAQPGSPLNDPYCGVWHGFDASLSQHRGGRVLLASATAVVLHTHADPPGSVSATAPTTWANADRVVAHFTYQAA